MFVSPHHQFSPCLCVGIRSYRPLGMKRTKETQTWLLPPCRIYMFEFYTFLSHCDLKSAMAEQHLVTLFFYKISTISFKNSLFVVSITGKELLGNPKYHGIKSITRNSLPQQKSLSLFVSYFLCIHIMMSLYILGILAIILFFL